MLTLRMLEVVRREERDTCAISTIGDDEDGTRDAADAVGPRPCPGRAAAVAAMDGGGGGMSESSLAPTPAAVIDAERRSAKLWSSMCRAICDDSAARLTVTGSTRPPSRAFALLWLLRAAVAGGGGGGGGGESLLRPFASVGVKSSTDRCEFAAAVVCILLALLALPFALSGDGLVGAVKDSLASLRPSVVVAWAACTDSTEEDKGENRASGLSELTWGERG